MHIMVTNIYFTNKIFLLNFKKKSEITIDYLGYQINEIQDKIK